MEIPTDLDHHPAANLFPLLDVDSPEFGELVHDIREHGLLQPIVLCDGKILDGRNRYRACQHAGIEPRFVEWSGDSPTAYVLSLNLHRRHLTHGQKAMIAADALPLFEAEARERQGRRTDLLGDPSTSGQTCPEVPRARDRAAGLTGVSGRTVQTAKAIKEKAPDLAEQVNAGKMSVHRADREMARRRAPVVQLFKEQQAAEIATEDDGQGDVADGEDQVAPTIASPPTTARTGHWSAEEREKRAQLEQGLAVAVNLRSHHNLIAWAKERGLFVRVDRATPWGNPFELGKDGDRDTVIANYRDHYLPFKPSLLERIGELRGKALGCWCAPESCHADVLAVQLGRGER